MSSERTTPLEQAAPMTRLLVLGKIEHLTTGPQSSEAFSTALPKACPLPSRYPATPPFRSHFLLLGDGSQRRRAFPAAVSGRRLGMT
ncbi:hypothetical protein SKAU_G00184460 [Synaphobranchus kaupii]|uniref:Uncharacterized protein n=1 Tax=Synaphobranchus kaupii TaxID=118154 RepID=A0A9Q1FCG3_SYNKA|nr:hypothetical protein SKAU_G00184460 [Synaphobranchus kaupii]